MRTAVKNSSLATANQLHKTNMIHSGSPAKNKYNPIQNPTINAIVFQCFDNHVLIIEHIPFSLRLPRLSPMDAVHYDMEMNPLFERQNSMSGLVK